jgi:hypothetical protein
MTQRMRSLAARDLGLRQIDRDPGAGWSIADPQLTQ